MNVGEFCEAVAAVGRQYGGSITSWGRTNARSARVGGFAGDPHTWWRGVDMVYDQGANGGANRPGSEDHVRSPRSCPTCSDHDLKVIHETRHDHYQPRDFPAGPVTEYPARPEPRAGAG